MTIDYMKTIGSRLLTHAMLTSCSKYGRMKELQFSLVQGTKEIFLESITMGFEPEYFVIHIAGDRE